jgi:hypothetical protein
MPVYYFKEAKNDVPELLIDEEKHYIRVSGSSYPEDIIEVYGDFLLDLSNIKIEPNSELICDFRFDILSSTTMRILHEIFTLFENYLEAGKEIEVNWFYDPDDEDMKDIGLTFAEILNLKINVISKESHH